MVHGVYHIKTSLAEIWIKTINNFQKTTKYSSAWSWDFRKGPFYAVRLLKMPWCSQHCPCRRLLGEGLSVLRQSPSCYYYCLGRKTHSFVWSLALRGSFHF